jgi:hypothetical protein
MNLNKLKEKIDALVAAGHGEKQVFYRHSASGDCGPVNGPSVSADVDDCGPFDIEDGEEFIKISVGY